MQKWRIRNEGVRDRGRWQGRVAGRRLRCIIDERPSGVKVWTGRGGIGRWDWACGIVRLVLGSGMSVLATGD